MENLYDVVIIGGGPSGLSAAIYLARAKYKVIVLEKEKFGGQITITHEVVNYPGVFSTSGEELTSNMQKQAQKFGAEFKLDEVIDLDLNGDIKTIKTKNSEYKALGVVLALGANPRKLGFEGEAKFMGRGVAYCATCDGEFFKDMELFVIGGGFAAVEEGIFLTKYASKVNMIVREPDFTCAKTVSDQIKLNDKINVSFNTEVVSIDGDVHLNKIVLKNNITNKEETINKDGFGVFVFAGYEPNTKWLKGIDLDRGYIVTDTNAKTNIDGVYASGDVCIKNLRQVVTAVSDGAIAATSLEKYVEELHHKLEIPELKQNKATESESNIEEDTTSFIDSNIKQQLEPILSRLENNVTIKAFLANDDLGKELDSFADECSTLSDKIKVEKEKSNISYIELLDSDLKPTNIRFQGVPGGHEFNSFIVALYNVCGPGKQLPQDIKNKIANITETDLKVLISLSCTMCPEVVQASQHIAALNKNVTATMVDINYNKELKEKYNVMSVPCLIINDKEVSFGKKGIEDILEILK
ncbi:MAG: FAD-dependent oxidoreductase [bacterium]